jgi:hypothetical protein
LELAYQQTEKVEMNKLANSIRLPSPASLTSPPSVFLQHGIEVFGTVLAQARQCPTLVAPHQAGVADHVCSNDCRQFALLTRQRHSPWREKGVH